MRASRSILACTAALALVAAAGCSSCKKGARESKQNLEMVPNEAVAVAEVNLDRMRGEPIWKRVEKSLNENQQNKQKYDDLVKETGFDPLKQLDTVFVAFGAKPDAGSYGGLLRSGVAFDQTKLVAYAKKEVQKDGATLQEEDYAGHKLYHPSDAPSGYVTFLDSRTIVFGGKDWLQKIIDLSSGKGESAAKNAELAALVKKTNTNTAMWGAGLVPESARQELQGNTGMPELAGMKDAYGSIDFAKGFALGVALDLGSAADAQGLVAKVDEQLSMAKKSPQVQLLGMTPYLDAVKASSKDSAFHLAVDLNQQQVDELVARIEGLLKTLGGSLGGGAPPSLPGQPMQP